MAEKIHRKDWPRVANKLGFFGEDTEDIQNAYSGSQQQVWSVSDKTNHLGLHPALTDQPFQTIELTAYPRYFVFFMWGILLVETF